LQHEIIHALSNPGIAKQGLVDTVYYLKVDAIIFFNENLGKNDTMM
jgi:hypothetical protein